MKRIAFDFMCVAFLVFLAACTAHEAKITEAGAKLLTQGDLEELLSKELDVSWATSRGSGTMKYKPDGTVTMKGSGFSDTGTYWIEDGMHCRKWETIDGGKAGCAKWYRVSEKEYHIVREDGTLGGKMYLK